MMSISTKINSGTDHTCKLLEFYFIIECSTQLLMNRIYQIDGSFYNIHTLFVGMVSTQLVPLNVI
jgi:hypothetical protein